MLRAQSDLTVKELKDYAYVIKVDPAQNKLVRSSDPELMPWLPKDKFGWWIPDQNYFDLFFQYQDFSKDAPRINFYQYTVLAVLKYDYQPWDLSLEAASLKDKTQTLSVQYRAKKSGSPEARKQVSVLILLIERNKKLEKIGVRNLNYVAYEFNGQCKLSPCRVQQAEIFPRAHSAERYLNAENPKPLVQYVLGREAETLLVPDAIETTNSSEEEIASADPVEALAVAQQALGQAQDAEQAAARQQAVWIRNRLTAERKKRALKQEEDSLKQELVLTNRKREQLRQRMDSLGQHQKQLQVLTSGTARAVHLADAEVQLAQSQEREGAKQQQLLAQARILAADRVETLQQQLNNTGEGAKVYRSGGEEPPRMEVGDAVAFLELTGCQLKAPDPKEQQVYLIRDAEAWATMLQAEDSLLSAVDFNRFTALVYHPPVRETPQMLIPASLQRVSGKLKLRYTSLSVPERVPSITCSVLLLEKEQVNVAEILVYVNGKQQLSIPSSP